MYNRIFIFGGTCSGKTTLAKELSEKLKISYYTTDNFLYKNFYGSKYSEAEVEKRLNSVAKKKHWIIEGVHDENWLLPAFKKSDFVIVLLPKRIELVMRAIKRAAKRQLGLDGKREKFKTSFNIIYYSWIYQKDSFVKHKKWIKDYKKRFILLKNNKEIKTFVRKIENLKISRKPTFNLAP